MQLSRVDTQRIVKPKDLHPKDSFVASAELEIEWDEEREVVYLRRVILPSAEDLEKSKKAKGKRQLAAIVPLDCVAFMWPAPGEE